MLKTNILLIILRTVAILNLIGYLILKISMMIIAFYIGKFFASSIKQTKTFIFELGLQNGTIAIFVADTFFGEVAFIIPAVTYSLIMFMTSIIICQK